jgi:hypothetical protein
VFPFERVKKIFKMMLYPFSLTLRRERPASRLIKLPVTGRYQLPPFIEMLAILVLSWVLA